MSSIVKALLPFEEAMKDKRLTSQFARGRFDDNMQVAAERQFAIQMLQKTEQLQRCTPESVAVSLLDASYSGLSLSPSLAHAYLIPYGDQCSFAPGYRGLMHLAYRAGTIKSVQVNLVYSHDPVFQVWTDEHGRHIRHEESRADNRGDVTHAYCIAYPTIGGPPIVEVMNGQQLRAIESAAKSRPKGGMVWRGPFRDEMCKKAVIRRASKFWPKDGGGALQHMMEVSDKYDSVDFSAVAPDDVEIEQEICMSADQVAELDGKLQDHGVPATVTGQWMQRYAERLGYAGMDFVPGRLHKQAEKELLQYADDWSKQ